MEDKLLSFHERLYQFLSKNLKIILLGVFLFSLLIIIGAGFYYYKKQKEEKAWLELAQLLYQRKNLQALEDLAKKHRGTSAGLQAYLLLWEIYYHQKDWNNLSRILGELKKEYPKKLEGILIYGEAKILESQGKKEEALKLYQKSLEKTFSPRPWVLIDIGRLAEELNQNSLALDSYEKVLKEDNNLLSEFVEYKIAQLKGKGG
ncbi:MAG: tetratricopeptide repeat protein [Thermodesulfobacteriaceae bacterium]|nr:tetratricopeptide repeat protein [Thermodesulfobacteriaceae bacterium]MCX8042249.1 tetratricopeptide repeat protein [Thermodesulfobacteriaceae bacterium]MDW8136542.1 tetratricopeptide repeat protein [Thermodesulfobacterium sp.]